MRFYEGVVYDVGLAIGPMADGVDYHILDRKSERRAFLKCGQGRELDVGDRAVLVLYKGKKRKVVKLPFVKEGERRVCDLPAFLEQKGIRYKVYKKTERNCGGGCWDSISYSECVCKNGELWWGSDWHIDWREYWLGICYSDNCPIIGGKKVSGLRFLSENHHAESEETLGWFKQSMEEQMHLSWREFGQVLENLGLRKESALFEITFCDGKLMVGKGINWND